MSQIMSAEGQVADDRSVLCGLGKTSPEVSLCTGTLETHIHGRHGCRSLHKFRFMNIPAPPNDPHAAGADALPPKGGETYAHAAPPAGQARHAASAGFFHHLWHWCEAMVHYLGLRSQLMLLEAKEAGSHYGVIAALFAGAALVALFAYGFLILTVVFALAAWIDEPHAWLIIMAGATGLHLVLAVVLVLMAKARLKAGVFEKTKEEFRKDKVWPKKPTPLSAHPIS